MLLKRFSQIDNISSMCWKCKKDVLIKDLITRTSECPDCKTDLHSCKNCVFYSKGSHYDCHETIEENVVDKERANFCEHFKIKRNWTTSSPNDKERKAFDALFS